MSLTYEQLVAAWSASRLTGEAVIAWFQDHRWLQHQALFARRHFCEPALFHQELVELFWSGAQRLGVFAFRGGAKSTMAEEFIALGAAELAFRNCVILGASEGRAAERIAAVKRELERNEDLVELYGEASWRCVDASKACHSQQRLHSSFGEGSRHQGFEAPGLASGFAGY